MGKWRLIRESKASKENFMDFVVELNGLSTLLYGIPAGVCDEINRYVIKTQGEIARKEKRLCDLNTLEMGKAVGEKCDLEDLEDIASRGRSIINGIQALRDYKLKNMDLSGTGVSKEEMRKFKRELNRASL